MSRMLSSYAQVCARALTGGALMGLLAATGVARAQEAPDTKAPSAGDIVVTAQRMEEKILDVPISISAFSSKDLSDLKIEGGSELLRAIPNVNFSKDNFTGYNFSIRGIGTKATSVTADPAVAISFNNTTLLRNRLFEQEYFDIERLEVLRGPQGTLYGRNATAGVVNMIPNKPKFSKFSGEIQGELGNYGTKRARGFINIPLGDNLAVRAAGAWTKRSGFDYNTVTDHAVNGRDLWSIRLSALWAPTSNFSIGVFWEHFKEDDNRSRTGKQLCTRTPTASTFELSNGQGTYPLFEAWTASALTPGCQNKSLFTKDAYGVPNGIGSPIVSGLLFSSPFFQGQYDSGRLINPGADPFSTVDNRQSSNLREIATIYDPVFKAKNDVVQLNLEYDPSPDLHLFSQTLYMSDNYFGSQDFFRFDSKPVFARREDYENNPLFKAFDWGSTPNWQYWLPYLGASTAQGGVICDPQLGCSDRPLAVDISKSKSEQWSQELRFQSSFSGPINFSIGGNWVKFKTQEEYNVYSNTLTAIALGLNSSGFSGDCVNNPGSEGCIYIDPNPLNTGPQEGHNYLRSVSIAKIQSVAGFGELYWKMTDNLKLTAGLRYTDDKKTLTPVPSQLLTSRSQFGGGFVDRGYPQYADQVQQWRRVTGRMAIDWKPDLSFSDSTLVYASYARGYKAGGGNPAGNDFDPALASYTQLPQTYGPEDVNAFEIGTKNQFAGGKLVFSAAAFFNDYKGYQISQLIDRTFHTENVDARTMGIEMEGAWIPSRNFRIGATFGYLNTKIAKGQRSIDVMDRLQGHDDWVTLRPWAQSPNTCIAPKEVVSKVLSNPNLGDGVPPIINPGNGQPPRPWQPGDPPVFTNSGGVFLRFLCESPNFFAQGSRFFAPGTQYSQDFGFVFDPTAPYDPSKPANYNLNGFANYGAPNQGRGFAADIGGNELPNAPHFTFNVGAQYTLFFGDWSLAVRGDYYRQSSSYARIYNTAYDKLKGWGNGNLALTLSKPSSKMTAQFYVKNIFNSTPITDAYTGPDELSNFTNVFTLDPRVYGLSLKAAF
ncbi:TonB-dependent receptor [Sphingomonas alpina]|uniref:TonB-dependent receptor n=1 Tax=Sphingomonas alpina TaxID=653931 RepID=A0A7H0LKJ8_9SPHN|nr:TonB-dependent receptor [Sphingomonas alpina]QNQ10201.1 TonB-dependent receptor [Sphingomonas alpina]